MYYFLVILLLIALFFSLLLHHRKKKIVAKITCMPKGKKIALLNVLADPFGYCYYCHCGCFSTTMDAWQKKAGYTYLYDHMAPRFGMVYQFLPVYFDYKGRTWLIEFWKGQYGINTGAEIGIYHADRIISPEFYKTTMFEAVDEKEMLLCSFLLSNKEGQYIQVKKKHWWLTAFLTGRFSTPSGLCMENSITFSDTEMLTSFIDGLKKSGYTARDVKVSGLTVTFLFYNLQKEEYESVSPFWSRYSQWKNKRFCKLYLWFTKPFCDTEDRILYLYYCLPFAFRKLLRLHRFDKRCHRKKSCMRKPS